MTEFAQRMETLRQRFIEQVKVDTAKIERLTAAHAWFDVRDICHKLAGRAGMFGFSDVTDAAGALEESVDADRPAADLLAQADRLVRLLHALTG